MTGIDAQTFFRSLGGLAALILGVVKFMLNSAEKHTDKLFATLKEDVRRQIEAGTDEHRDFRKELLKHSERLHNHDELFRELTGHLGKLTGQMEMAVGLLKELVKK